MSLFQSERSLLFPHEHSKYVSNFQQGYLFLISVDLSTTFVTNHFHVPGINYPEGNYHLIFSWFRHILSLLHLLLPLTPIVMFYDSFSNSSSRHIISAHHLHSLNYN